MFCADASLSDFPRFAGETDDAPRIRRAIEMNPSGVVYFPKGVYEIASPIEVTNPPGFKMDEIPFREPSAETAAIRQA